MGSSPQQREGQHTWVWRPGAPALLPESREERPPRGPRPWHGRAGCSHFLLSLDKNAFVGPSSSRSLPPCLFLPRSVRRTGGASVRSSASPSTPVCTTGAHTSGSHSTRVPEPWATQRGPSPEESIPCGHPRGPREGTPLSSGRAGGKQAWGGSCRRSPVVQATVHRTWLLLLTEEVQGPQDRQPGAAKSAQMSCRGDAACYSQGCRGWTLRADLGQITHISGPVATAEALGKVPSTLQVSLSPSAPRAEGCLRQGGEGRETP